MLLGDLIVRLRDETVVSETLQSLGDLALTARVVAQAGDRNMSAGEFSVQALDDFVASAGDDEWLTLLGRMSRSDDPGGVFLRFVLSRGAPA